MIKGFLEFVRTQGVMGLAVGFLLGGAVSRLVTALVTDIINPLLAPILGASGNFRDAVINLGPVHLMYGDFIAQLIDFIVIAAIVYFGVHGLGLDRIDKKKINETSISHLQISHSRQNYFYPYDRKTKEKLRVHHNPFQI